MKSSFLLIVFLFISSATVFSATTKIISPDKFFENGYFKQNNVDISNLSENKIKAKIDGSWGTFNIVSLPEKVMDWNIKRRLKALSDIQSGQRPSLAGPHNGIVATYGYQREDSLFKLNNSVKGMGFLPKKESIKNLIKKLEETADLSFMDKLKIIESLYQNVNTIFDLRAQVSLELYSKPEFVTQTFLNQAANPLSTVVFLDIPSFKFKAITLLIDEKNPNLTDYEKDIVKYTNLIHSYFHGQFDRQFIGVVYYFVEVYDNSPGKEDGKGKKIVPLWP